MPSSFHSTSLPFQRGDFAWTQTEERCEAEDNLSRRVVDQCVADSLSRFERVGVSRLTPLDGRQAPGVTPRVDRDVVESKGVLEHPAGK